MGFPLRRDALEQAANDPDERLAVELQSGPVILTVASRSKRLLLLQHLAVPMHQDQAGWQVPQHP
jgi:hypothetical protein